MIASNLVAAIVVFAYLVVVVPAPTVNDTTHVKTVNLIVFTIYLAIAFPVGAALAIHSIRPIRAWLLAGRPPTAAERDYAVRAPLRQAVTFGALWAGAALVFFVLNAQYSLGLATEVGVSILLGGVVTSALGYLLLERINRGQTVLALAIGAPERPVAPGVSARLLVAWALGTGIFLVAILVLVVAVLITPDQSVRRVSASVLLLSVGGLAVGALVTVVAARAIADPLESVRSALGEVERGSTDVEVPIEDGSEIGLLQSGVNRMVAGLREHERLRDLFGRHVGEDVARRALERGVALGGEVREAAVLFVDVVGSTALAASRPPDEVVAQLNAFFAIVVDAVRTHGGWVNKFEGDAALCVFGAPLDLDDAAGCALRAARAMRDRLAAELPALPAGIGVSAGAVVAGNVGAEERFEYTVIGDPVNEAARLTELAKRRDGRLLASEAVVSRAGSDEAARWRLDGSVELRGRPEPTRVAVA